MPVHFATAVSSSVRPVTDFSVRFWGVRGSVPCPEAGTARYGGNTACVEVRCGDHLLIFDAGTGLRPLGKALARANAAPQADIFFSHCHIDHIVGVPFFAPCYVPAARLRLWAGNLLPEYRLEQILRRMMAEPLFPIGFDALKAHIEFHDFRAGDVLRPHPDVTLRTAPLNHPGRATGYRVEYKDRSVAYITDTEHNPNQLDRNVLWLAHAADLMIYDSNFTEEEFPRYTGWGHSTWQEGIRIAESAAVKTLALFHHDPEHDDDFLDRIGAEARKLHPGTIVASEGTSLDV
jgi:phosphoribosyl 1,2-cyclic phosphodiesterase